MSPVPASSTPPLLLASTLMVFLWSLQSPSGGPPFPSPSPPSAKSSSTSPPTESPTRAHQRTCVVSSPPSIASCPPSNTPSTLLLPQQSEIHTSFGLSLVHR